MTRAELLDRAYGRMRLVLLLLLAALPLVFAIGRGTGERGMTVRAAETAPAPSELPYGVKRFHDASQGVTCWVTGPYVDTYNLTGVSCLPDQWLASAREAE